MIKKISLVTCGLLLGSTMAFGADSINDAFAKGSFSGNITFDADSVDAKGGSADTNTYWTTTGLSYETASYMGLSAKASFIAGHAADDATLANDSLMTEAYVKYAGEGFAVSVGRQAIDLEWLGDYNESVVAAITAIPDTTLVLGYVNQQTAADEDEIGSFSKINGSKGAYVVDAKYAGVKGLELNPYYYSAPDVANFYGLKATYTTDMMGVVAQYAASSEDIGADGSIAHVSVNGTVAGVSAAIGYIDTDKSVGAKSIAAFGDNISPFDNGANTYAANAETVYGSVGYSVAGVDLGLLYGETEFAINSEEKELNLTAAYSITKNLGLGLLYVDYDLEGSSSNDYKSVSATLAYSF